MNVQGRKEGGREGRKEGREGREEGKKGGKGGRKERREGREGREGGGRREDVTEYLEGEASCHYISVGRDNRNIVQNDSVLTLHHLKQQQQQQQQNKENNKDVRK